MRLPDLGLTLSPCLQLKLQHRHLLLEGREVQEGGKQFRAHAFFCRLDFQVLLGLLGWRSQPALGGGRLRGGEASALPRDLTITTCAPWDPGALSSAPGGSSNRDDGNTEMAETGFISESRQTIIANINSPDQID